MKQGVNHAWQPALSVASGRFASDANLYEGSSSGPGTPLRQAEDTTSKPNAVLDQLEWLLQQAGYAEGEDYTRESLEQPTPMAELYPEFSGSAQLRSDPPFEDPLEPRQFTEYTYCDPWLTEVYWYHPNYLGSVDLVTDLSGHAHQFFMYTAWGEPMYDRSSFSGGFDAPFRFNGKELDKETGYGYYGARYYQNRLSMWLSVDPLAHVAPSWSPYRSFFCNPINHTDPTGLFESPIYDKKTGDLLGTDDQGLQGDAIVMEKSDFTQGMSHSDALSKNQGFNSLSNDAAKLKYNTSFNSLSNRPDYDGKITVSEANEWFRSGNKTPLFADLSQIDFAFVKSSDFKGVGDKQSIQTLYDSDDGLVYGQITLEYLGNNQVSSVYDRYNFERHNRGNQSGMSAGEKVSANVKLMLRNMATFGGRTVANRHPVNMHNDGFLIKFYGKGNIGK